MSQAKLLSVVALNLEKNSKVRLAWIYGSFATGQEKADSDIDIAVAGVVPFSADERVNMALELSLIVKREVDLVDLQSERGVIMTQVLTRGKLIVKKDRDLLAMLLRRMWFDRADFGSQRDSIFRARREKAFGKK